MKNRKYIGIIIVLISAIVLIACVAYFIDMKQDKQKRDEIPKPVKTESVEGERVIDFDDLIKENDDTIGWIEVPGTGIDEPILICGEDVFYIDHDFYGEYDIQGAIFVDDFNGRDFSQLHTVIYGHDTYEDTMFTPLHKYYDKEFFDNNREVYIYTPDKEKLTYRIFAAYERDDAYILKTYDYNTAAGHEQYLAGISQDVVGAVNIDEEALSKITSEDKIITLYTCTRAREDWRYIVQAVYVPEE